MKNLPTFKQLQYLIALDEQKSFSKAAVECNVTQSTLSAGIAALENIISQPVIDRTQRHVVLSAAGEMVVGNARTLISQADDMMMRLQKSAAPLCGPLRLGVIPTIAPYLLPLVLPGLQKTYPALELHIHEQQSAQLVEDVHKGRLDVGLLAFPYDTQGLEDHVIFHENFVLAAPRGGWHGKTPLAIKDLADQELLLLEDGHCLRDQALAACRLQPASTRKTFSATSLATLIQMVGHGYGVTLLPEMATVPKSLPKTIEIIPFKSPAPGREIGLCWRRNHPRAEEFALLGQALNEYH